MAGLPQGSKKGKSRDIVAEQVGFKSGREVERAISVAKVIKEAEANGNKDNSDNPSAKQLILL